MANTATTQAMGSRFLPLQGSMSPPPPSRTSHKSTIPQRFSASAPDLRTEPSVVTGRSQTSDDMRPIISSSSTRSSYSHPDQRQPDAPREHNIVPLSLGHDDELEEPSRSGSRSPTSPAAETQIVPIEHDRNIDVMLERLQDLRRTLAQRQRRANGPSLRGMWNAIRGIFGFGPEGTNARKELVSLLLKIVFGVGQIAAIIALSVIAAITTSPTHPGLNEWQACHRPIGVWSAIWSVRVVLGCIVTVWAYQAKVIRTRDTARLASRATENNADADGSDRERHDAPGTDTGESAGPVQPPLRPINPAISRLGSLLSLVSAAWFIVAHILIYASINSCRLSSPHLWWLAFGIICIGYLVLLELVFVVLLVFVIGPLLFIIINLILFCLGREPLLRQRINPEIGKLSAKAVDSIPLVFYIPAPIAKEEADNAENAKPTTVVTPEAALVHSYPPDIQRPAINHSFSQGTRVQSRSRRLFTFRRVKLKRQTSNDSDNDKPLDDADLGNRYEDKWEKSDYPFVKLEENRTTCAICLCDFEEPKRVRYSIGSKPPEDVAEAEAAVGIDVASGQDDRLRLADPGEGAQPLRLLECAHVFHKTCIDPWLIEVSGRCPVCQRPVEIKEPPKSRRSRRRGP